MYCFIINLCIILILGTAILILFIVLFHVVLFCVIYIFLTSFMSEYCTTEFLDPQNGMYVCIYVCMYACMYSMHTWGTAAGGSKVAGLWSWPQPSSSAGVKNRGLCLQCVHRNNFNSHLPQPVILSDHTAYCSRKKWWRLDGLSTDLGYNRKGTV